MIKLTKEEVVAILTTLGKLPTEQVFDLYAFFRVKLQKNADEEALMREGEAPSLEAVK
jgi:hypothetical protein